MEKILITGGSGFIGTNLINFLLQKNYKITNVDKYSKISTPEKFKIKSNHYKFCKFNIANNKKIQNILLTNFDTIIHLAAESHVDRSIDEPKKFFFENVSSTLNFYDTIRKLLKEEKIKQPKIIHISTDEVYGSVAKGLSNEKSKIFSSSPYSASKAASENIAQFYMKTFDLNISILRISNNYGPFQFPEKFIPKTILRIFKKKNIPLYGDGKNIREWLYVEDTCEAIYLLIKNFVSNKIFNIGSSEKLSNKDVIVSIFKICKYPMSKVDFVKDRPGHDFRYALDSNSFKKTFNWKPKNNFKQGIKKTIIWYKKNHKWINDITKKYNDSRLGIR